MVRAFRVAYLETCRNSRRRSVWEIRNPEGDFPELGAVDTASPLD